MKTKPLFAALLVLGGLVAANSACAQGTRDQIRMIEQEYARDNNGASIPDNQLEYYLDRSSQGWSMQQIASDIRAHGSSSPWRPQSGWVAREVICTSINGAYRECAAPFRGTAVVTEQISQAACVEGRSWGQKPGAIWVNNGCRARFGIVRGNNNPGPFPPRVVTCASNQGRYKECNTGTRDRVRLVTRLRNSLACTEGRSWGQRRGVVWVSRGCRAQFAAVGRPGMRDDGVRGDNGWVRDPNYAVNCVSADGRRTVCTWDNRYGRPTLVERRSGACVEGRDWGYDANGELWVTSGCGARFGYGPAGPATTTWVRDPNYSVSCASMDGRRTVCTWDNRYGNPYIVQRMSDSACIEGRDWGYDAAGGLWVNSGCRARFGYR